MEKRIGFFGLLGFIGLLWFAGLAAAADLQWDYPADWDAKTGWTIYFTDGVENYNKTIGKTDVQQDGIAVTYADFETKLNIPFDTEFTIYLTSYNDNGESGPSNNVVYVRSGYDPPVESLPPAPVSSPSSPTGLRTN